MTSIPTTGARSRKGTVERKSDNLASHHSHPMWWIGLLPIQEWFLFSSPTHLSSTPLSFFFSSCLSGGGKCLIFCHMAKCPFWMQWMPAAEGGQTMPSVSIQGAWWETTEDLMLICDAEDCTAYNRTVYVGFSFCAFFPCNCESKIINVEFL